MRLKTLNQLALAGFLSCFFSTLGTLVVINMPALDPIQEPILWFMMLPAGITGLAVIAFEKMQTPASDKP
jgi:hypothetical protein